MELKNLFTNKRVGSIDLPNRIVMAPLTRSRSSQPGDIPNDLNAKYYAQRASAALIITEATQISPQGKGYAYTPGIYSDEQIEGWRKVVDAVHQEDGKIFLQLWHVGRISHRNIQPDNQLPVAPSAIRPEGQAFTEEGMLDFEVPRALETEEVKDIVEQYVVAAKNAKAAGFDGVEVHAANGYLLDQFLKSGSNKRNDIYGGSVENRSRLTLEVVEAVTNIWGGDRVGIRISPTGTFNSMHEPDPQPLFNYLVEQLNKFSLAYLHVVESFGDSADVSFDFGHLREVFNGNYMANGGYTADKAEKSIAEGKSDLVSFGAMFISNPDLVERFSTGADLAMPDQATFYGGGAEGYIDYPRAS